MLTTPAAGTPLAVEMRTLKVRTDRHGDADLTALDGDYSYISVKTLGKSGEAVPWGNRDGWHVRIYRDAKPAKWRRVRLSVTTMRAEDS